MKMKLQRAAMVAAVLATTNVVMGQDQATLNDLQKQIKDLQSEVQRLKEGPPRDAEAEMLLGQRFLGARGLKIGFYGESKFRFPSSGANNFDAHRYVLSPSYEITDWLIFNSELELEHGAVDASTSRSSRFDGELELEQFYVDILLNEHFNIRSLGIDLVPVGRINKYHEPTVFYSTERPELYREIIPSTWMEPSVGAFGNIIEGLSYQVMVSTGLEDAIGGNANTSGAGITAASGARDARPRLRGGDENNLAYSARLSYKKVPGLDLSTSVYATRMRTFNEMRSSAVLWDVEALYRLPGTGLEVRGDFAQWHFGDSQNLIANNNASAVDDVGDRMYGWYGELAYHLWPEAWRNGKGANMDIVPFVRYSEIRTQVDTFSGRTLPKGTGNKDFVTLGLSWFLNENFVIKADYRKNLNSAGGETTSGANQDYFQMGVGMFF